LEALWNSVLARLISECGVVGIIGYLYAIAISYLLNKRTSAWEKDRADIEKRAAAERERFLGLVMESHETVNDLTVAVEKANAVNSAINALQRQI
jgi:hypothetical protein